MKLLTYLHTQNDCYKAGKPLNVKGFMLHSTGANNPKLCRYVASDSVLGENKYRNDWNTSKPGGRSVCVHGFIGKLASGEIATCQTLPWDMRGWHCGGAGNDTLIGVEICEDALNDKAYLMDCYNEAAELVIMLAKRFGFTEKDVICHSEGYKMGIASNHGDVMHWFSKHGLTMDDFRNTVKQGLSNQADTEKIYRVQVGAFTNRQNAANLATELKQKGYQAFVTE